MSKTQIPYLAKFAQKELDTRYQRCLKVLIELGINEVEAKKQVAKGVINLYPVRKKVTDTSVTALAEHCSGLTMIKLNLCSKITDTSVTALANNCSGLTEINLGWCSKITDAGVTALANNCSELTTIDLRYCSKITDTSVTALAEHCSGLTKIHLDGCSKITDAAKQPLRDKGVLHVYDY